MRTAGANRRSKPLRWWQSRGDGGGFPQAGVRRRTWEHRVDGRRSGSWKPLPLTRRRGKRPWLLSRSHFRVGSRSRRDRERQRFGSPPRSRSKTPRRRSLPGGPSYETKRSGRMRGGSAEAGTRRQACVHSGSVPQGGPAPQRAARRESGELGRSARERARESSDSWVLEAKQSVAEVGDGHLPGPFEGSREANRERGEVAGQGGPAV